MSYATAGGTGATSTDIALGATDSSGAVNASSKSVTALQRKISVTAKAGTDVSTAKEFTIGTVPSNFLTGQSVSEMNWAAAKTYCASHGGKLPLIAGNTSLNSVNSGDSVDGFGTIDGSWPSVLPSGVLYWTGTAHGRIVGYAWEVHGATGPVSDTSDSQSKASSVVCVP